MVFGRVVKGMSVLRKIEDEAETGEEDTLETECVIVDCGELPIGAPDGVPEDPLDKYEANPLDNVPVPSDIDRLTIAGKIKDAGNTLFKQGMYDGAIAKYMKAVTYLRATRSRATGSVESTDEQGQELLVHRSVHHRRLRGDDQEPDPDADSSPFLKEPAPDAGGTGILVEHGDVVAVLERSGDEADGFIRVRLTHGNNTGKEGWLRAKDLHVLAKVESQNRLPDKKEVTALKIQCFRNRAQCCAKQEDWKGVKRATREALKIEGGDSDPRVLYRHAEAIYLLGEDDDEAFVFAKKALKEAPKDSAIAALAEKISTRRKGKRKELSAQMAKGIDLLGKAPTRFEVCFEDREKLKPIVVFSPKRGEICYSFAGKDRDPDREIDYNPSGGFVRFPNIMKRVNLPGEAGKLAEILSRLRELCETEGIRHNLPVPAAAEP
eukprot:Hpha_TRINITY_DN15415_c2_g4::TRINITY_DN15415_c2_g4_i1::g.175504::m.175504/K05864/PPID, CYPD; peptidyl-prolyl isomerase D